MGNFILALLAIAAVAATLLVAIVRRRSLPIIISGIVFGFLAFGLLITLENPVKNAEGASYLSLWNLRFYGFNILFLACFIALLVGISPIRIVYRNVSLAVGLYLLLGIFATLLFVWRAPALGLESIAKARSFDFYIYFGLSWPYQLLLINGAFGLGPPP